MNNTDSVERLTRRWYDRREVMNLAGKYVTSILLEKSGDIYGGFWSSRDDVCLSYNDGSYVGCDAVRGYYQAVTENTDKTAAFLKELFPAELDGKDVSALRGIGQMNSIPITTPIVEIAMDGLTAKGIWHVLGSDSHLTTAGPISYWSLGFLAIDFILENGSWKLWHVLHAEDISVPMGDNWLKPRIRPSKPEHQSVAVIKLPPYTIQYWNYTAYSKERAFTAPPKPPEPYAAFSETFSYGVTEKGDAI